ncbi:MAG: metalloregulator ArsR/SmtB family transcription factor [Pseudobdellovibrionaceae bacterium]|jgi:DNA-binding transcriptional ArsR family regulator|nr:metalloregulator ArsR/SmtB family transcription factor [Pseudobdellovibrionaceae bacterium]
MRSEIECSKINTKQAASILKALSNEKRLLVVCKLLKQELCVNELEKISNLSQSALSQHLAKLRSSGLVETRRNAQTIYYSVKEPIVRQLLECLGNLFSEEGPPPRADNPLNDSL